MLSLSRVLLLAAAGPLMLGACTTRTVTTSEYSSVSSRTDQALATAQQALMTAQQAEADARTAEQQTGQVYQRSLTK